MFFSVLTRPAADILGGFRGPKPAIFLWPAFQHQAKNDIAARQPHRNSLPAEEAIRATSF
jgi:hypothetical protein